MHVKQEMVPETSLKDLEGESCACACARVLTRGSLVDQGGWFTFYWDTFGEGKKANELKKDEKAAEKNGSHDAEMASA